MSAYPGEHAPARAGWEGYPDALRRLVDGGFLTRENFPEADLMARMCQADALARIRGRLLRALDWRLIGLR